MKKVKLLNNFTIGVTRLSVPPPGFVKFEVRECIPTASGKEYWGRQVSLLLAPCEVKDLIRVLQEEYEQSSEEELDDK